MLFSRPVPIDAALAHQHAKTVLPTSLSSREIQEQLSVEIRRQSFYSARTTKAGYLSDAARMIKNLVSGDTVEDPETGALRPRAKGEGFNPSLVRTRMQNYLKEIGYQPDPSEAGSLTDLSSDKRVDLIIDTQTKMAQGYARHEAAQDEDVLNDFPADEMYRQRQSRQQRDWDIVWNTARRELGDATSASLATSKDGPFVALKNDPIWTAISRFGNPYPPFDYGSGMWVRDADDALAERLGVLKHARFNPAHSPFSDPAQLKAAPPASMGAELAQALKVSLEKGPR